MRLEFGGAGVDPLEDRMHAQIDAGAAHLFFVASGQHGKAGIGKAHHLSVAQALFGHRQAVAADTRLCLYDFADAGAGTTGQTHVAALIFIDRQPMAHGLGDGAHPVGRAGTETARG
nr:hypothetical protein [Hyphobacterium sp. CCMP332]